MCSNHWVDCLLPLNKNVQYLPYPNAFSLDYEFWPVLFNIKQDKLSSHKVVCIVLRYRKEYVSSTFKRRVKLFLNESFSQLQDIL